MIVNKYILKLILYVAGFEHHQLDTMACIAEKESSLRIDAVNVNKNGSKDLGLFQINSVHHDTTCKGLPLFHAYYNSLCAKNVYDIQGFKAWVVYNKGLCRDV
jgi:hypothetical protein